MLLSLLLCSACYFVESARILGAFSFPSYSHQGAYQPIWRELALRGHDVVVLTTDPIKESIKTLTEIDVNNISYEIFRARHNFSNPTPMSLRAMVEEVYESVGVVISNKQLEHPEFQAILNNETEHFDLVMVEWFTPAMFALSAKYNCPLIGISSIGALNALYDLVGNPMHPIAYPGYMLPFAKDLNFWERLVSVYFSICFRYFFHNEIMPKSDEVVKKHFGEHIPPLSEIAKNVSMVFLNVNPLLSVPMPNVPAIVEYYGIHLKPKKPLPQDIKEFLDSAIRGAIYFSFGSTVLSKDLPIKSKRIILEALGELPYKILWKYEEEKLEGKPDNMKIGKWLPQQDILGHPNVKVFIFQGGLQSLEEAIFNKVPLVGMPMVADQPRNVEKVVELGIGRKVDMATLTKESFKKAVLEVINNPIYRNNIKELSSILDDQPMKQLDKVIWWIEYVIRNKGARHMRSPFIDMPYWKYLLLDVVAFVIVCILVVMFITIKFLKLLRNIFHQDDTSKKLKRQ